MEIKYEPVFGDQSLLAEAGTFTGLDVVVRNVDTDLYHYCRHEDLTYDYLRKNPVVAMRRIIAEHKRWTVADQNAGRLPEVGAELIHKTRGICEFIGVGLDEDACWALKQQSGSIYIADKSWCQPIETPEERAKREREEWCSKALDSAGILSEMKRYELKRLGEYIGSIHDALQSGELPMPGKWSE